MDENPGRKGCLECRNWRLTGKDGERYSWQIRSITTIVKLSEKKTEYHIRRWPATCRINVEEYGGKERGKLQDYGRTP